MKKIFFSAWGFVLVAASLDALYAVLHRDTFGDWELNPLARLLGLPGILALKALGLAFCVLVAWHFLRANPGHSLTVTGVAFAAHLALAAHYLVLWGCS